MDLGLKGRVAIVAAASKGLGRAVAEELARDGVEVAICARSAANVEKAVESIRKATGREVFARELDVTRADAVHDFVAAVEKRFGRVDICVTNAGGPPSKPFLDTSIEEWRAAFDLTLMSAVYFAREVLPLMRQRKWGRLIAITSVSVKQPIDNLMLSNSLRAGVTGLMRTLANEFGPDNITVNCVCPGFTLTERLDELSAMRAKASGVSFEKILEGYSANVPLRRIGKPEEFAAMVAFLASERASYINGCSIPVDGGFVKGLL